MTYLLVFAQYYSTVYIAKNIVYTSSARATVLIQINLFFSQIPCFFVLVRYFLNNNNRKILWMYKNWTKPQLIPRKQSHSARSQCNVCCKMLSKARCPTVSVYLPRIALYTLWASNPTSLWAYMQSKRVHFAQKQTSNASPDQCRWISLFYEKGLWSVATRG